ncbi:YtxH domain-containing protein [Bacillus sp. BRMEA1]|uniref:YtxH domain-containing protein n=1 Tax=Neobacillus endophyticus TaxID=2738405 RepID=UPI001565BD56|nr:YtxH domain-containing protein [Neobacillus endophyticus]NRD78362.1 YtxH domain-containing protein [Neobacillus endophyticus]
MKWKLFLSGIFAGSVAAGITTLLTAKNSGKITRGKLKENKQFIFSQMNELKTNLQEIKTAASEAVTEAKTSIPSFISDTTASFMKWREDTQLQQQEIQRELLKIKSTVQNQQ